MFYFQALSNSLHNTELINSIHRLGHGVSYSVLSEMHTENVFVIQDHQQEQNVVIPLEIEKEAFTTYVADNIDRKEETSQVINID